MSKHGMLHMDPPNVRNIADLLRELAAVVSGVAAAAPADRDTQALRDLAKRARGTSEILGTEYWALLDGEDSDWSKS